MLLLKMKASSQAKFLQRAGQGRPASLFSCCVPGLIYTHTHAGVWNGSVRCLHPERHLDLSMLRKRWEEQGFCSPDEVVLFGLLGLLGKSPAAMEIDAVCQGQ